MLIRQASVQVQPTTQNESFHSAYERKLTQTQEHTDDNIYEMILTHNVIKSINIINTIKEKDTKSLTKKHIVNYVIEIKTDYFDYQISKRYKEFASLYEQLKSQVILPKFPQKIIIQTNKKEVINERKQIFQSILTTCLSNLFMINYHYFFDFLCIREQFLKRGCTSIRLHGISTDQISLNDIINNNSQKYQPQNDTEKTIYHYVQKLNQLKESRGKIFTKLEDFLFGKMSQVTYNTIQYLFAGDSDNNIQGIITMFGTNSAQCKDHHICCISGFQLIRKLMEFDYNPYYELAVKAFCDLSMKQIKSMRIQDHIKGNNSKKCQENALFILHKYVTGNPSLSDQFLKYMIEDEETFQFYQNYKNTQRQLFDSHKNLDSSEDSLSGSGNTNRKSSSKDLPIEEESPEYLEKLLKKDLNWKLVVEYKNCSLKHVQGQLVKTKYFLQNCDLERAYQLFTSNKSWKKQFNKFEILEKIDDQNFIAYESFTWSQKSNYSTFIFLSNFNVVRTENKIILKVTKLNEQQTSKYNDMIQKGEILCTKVSYIELEKDEVNKATLVTTMKSLIDQDHKTHYLPQLLNEDASFQSQIDLLYQMI